MDGVKNKNDKSKLLETFKKYQIVAILLGMILLVSAINIDFLSLDNLSNLLTQSSIYGILALGLLLVIVSKGIDLSVGSVLAFAGVVSGSISQVIDATGKVFPNMQPVPIGVTILAALSIGMILGAVNGALIAYTGIPAFISTLGMYTAARGAALMYTTGKPISNINPAIKVFGAKILGPITMPVIIYFIVAAITFIILRYTSFGKSVYAIGGNIQAAEISGIKVKRNLVFIYAYSGMLAGLCSIIYMGRTGGSIQPAAAIGYELFAIAATTIGGTSHSGGIGTVWGTIVGALILGTLANGFTILGINAYIQQIVQGVIIVAAVVFDMRKNKGKK